MESELELRGHDKYVGFLATVGTDDGRALLVSTDTYGSVCIWDPLTGELVSGPIAGDEARRELADLQVGPVELARASPSLSMTIGINTASAVVPATERSPALVVDHDWERVWVTEPDTDTVVFELAQPPPKPGSVIGNGIHEAAGVRFGDGTAGFAACRWGGDVELWAPTPRRRAPRRWKWRRYDLTTGASNSPLAVLDNDTGSSHVAVNRRTSITVWDVATRRRVAQVDFRQLAGRPLIDAMAPVPLARGPVLAVIVDSDRDHGVQICDPYRGQLVGEVFNRHGPALDGSGDTTILALTAVPGPDGTIRVATGGKDGVVRLSTPIDAETLLSTPMGAETRAADDKPATAEGLDALVSRYRLGSGPFYALVPPLTGELVKAQRAGRYLATEIASGYADRLYAATWDAISGRDGQQPPPRPRHGLLVRDGRIVQADDPTRPAVPLTSGGLPRPPFNVATLDERGIYPTIHLMAAIRALSSAQSAEETGAPADLSQLLDRAWFLLAFWLSTSLGDGRMVEGDRALIVQLIDCCTRLHVLGEPTALPPFVADAIEKDLLVRHYDQGWVTTAHVRTTDGRVYSEGHPTIRDSDHPLRVGALLRAHLDRDTAGGDDPAAEFALGQLKVEADDLAGARTAFERARSHPDWSARAEACLADLLPQEAGLELASIFGTGSPDAGSPARARVVEIGEQLNAAGGTQLMRRAHQAVSQRLEREDAAGLEIIWDGIGDWQS
jgi:hypothetical protein